jgi:hypothetical protein
MSVTPQRFTFGQRAGNVASMGASNAQERPKAQFWLNIGYKTGDDKYPFVALPNGIPLDMSDQNELRGNSEYVQFLSAQNDLLTQIIEEASKLQPGEDKIIEHPEMPLAFQFRRIREDAAHVPADQNTLSRQNLFSAPQQEEEQEIDENPDQRGSLFT